MFPQVVEPQVKSISVLKPSVSDKSLVLEPIYRVPQSLDKILEAIVKCESGGNPLATNPNSSAKGLLQILDGTWQDFKCQGNPFNSEDNWQCGLKIATESGLHHWNASKACWGN